MIHPALRLVLLTAAAAAALGCSTAYTSGASALRQGRYVDAVQHFEEVLAKDPDRLDAQIGLGLAKYRLGELQEATEHLGRAVARAPRDLTARVYLGLAHLGRGEDGPAEEHLTEAMRIAPGTRTAAQIDRALKVMRGRDPISADMRTFIAGSIEDSAELERQAEAARAAQREAELRSQYPYYPAYAPIIIRRGDGRRLLLIP